MAVDYVGLAVLAGGGFGVYLLAKNGSLEGILPGAQKTARQLTTTPVKQQVLLAAAKAKGTALKNFADLTAQPGEKAMSAALGRSVWSIREAVAISGKNVKDLTLSDFQNIPDLPSQVFIGPQGQISLDPFPGGVASSPSETGHPANVANPTGGSGTWGGLNDQQIQAAFAASGQDWQAQHDQEVAAHGF